MAAAIDGVLPKTLQENIKTSKVLVVGAGGIGCEVLKNLVLSGFADIEIIDLDTIDLSNLNRQFLFHREHVGKSKAQVARESALRFNPDVKITAYHDSVTTNDYGVNFFKKFDVVLSALDNKAARNHVNRMCLNADVPLIESGTSGYNGQVEVIKKGHSLCYECTPKPVQKTFPGCTIRNTPSEPIHCIVWAKHLFNQLFGETVEDEDISPDMADPEAKEGETAEKADESEKSNGDEEPPVTDSGNVVRINTRQWAKDSKFDAEKLFNKFFYDDIKYLLSMSNLWKTRKPPNPLQWNKLVPPQIDADAGGDPSYSRQYHKVWELEECAKVFANCLKSLSQSFLELDDGDSLVWDKDDQPAMDFVAACANIRAYIFQIERKSRFEIKSMAGNIIPAIATTNAITAGISVLRAFNVLQSQYDKCKSVYARLKQNGFGAFIMPDKKIVPPNPNCYVCSAEPAIHLRIDTNRVRIKEFRDEVLIKTLNMINPDVTVEGKGIILISSEEGETECNEPKLLSDMEIVDGVLLKCDDFFQNYALSIIVVHFDAEKDAALFEVIADKNQLKSKEEMEVDATVTDSKANGDAAVKASDDDDVGPSTSKRSCVAVVEDDDDDLILVEDENVEIVNPETVTAATDKLTVTSPPAKSLHTAGTKRKTSDVVEDVTTISDSDDDDDELAPSKSKRKRHENTAMETINID